MNILLVFVILYMTISVGIGVMATRKVSNSTDYVLAGRSLPMHITIATVFATWFGSEAVLGIPATFMEEGIFGVLGDPFGAGICLILVGLIFSSPLYKMKLLTIGDFYRQRYSKTVEKLVSFAICVSYLGWVSAQIVALGLAINIITQNSVSQELSMLIGLTIVVIYTIFGGMWSVAIMDFLQMITIIIGLSIVAYLIANEYQGGASGIINHAIDNNRFKIPSELSLNSIFCFISAFLTMALGSIPQQDVFQRVMSSKNETTAKWGSVIGGSFYILFCFIPIFIVYGASLLSPELVSTHLMNQGDPQRILPEYILSETPTWVQVMFFGALLSAIMSTASGTLLAPSVVFAENILRDSFNLTETQLLKALRLSVLGFSFIVYGYAYMSQSVGLSIFEMVENAYLVTLCGAFVPLTFGLFWKKANNSGALISITLGVTSWAILESFNTQLAIHHEALTIPPQMIGLVVAIIGMIIGSLLPIKKQNLP